MKREAIVFIFRVWVEGSRLHRCSHELLSFLCSLLCRSQEGEGGFIAELASLDESQNEVEVVVEVKAPDESVFPTISQDSPFFITLSLTSQSLCISNSPSIDNSNHIVNLWPETPRDLDIYEEREREN